MGAKNRVVAGDYEKSGVFYTLGKLSLRLHGQALSSLKLDKSTVRRYEVVDTDKKKSAVSAVGRAALGKAFFGSTGAFAGISAKNKGVYLVSVEFCDGKKSLMEIDEMRYKALVKVMF